MYRIGTISEIDSEKVRVRVDFEEDGIVSPWLPVLVQKSKEDKYFHIFDIGETVACLMNDNNDTGIVIGAIYTAKHSPAIQGKDLTAVKFKDGTEIEYDREAHKLRLKIVGDLTIVCDNDVNVQCKTATVRADTKVTIDSPTAEFTGDVNVEGELMVFESITAIGNIDSNGTISAIGDVEAAAGVITLLLHKHPTPVGPTLTPIP